MLAEVAGALLSIGFLDPLKYTAKMNIPFWASSHKVCGAPLIIEHSVGAPHTNSVGSCLSHRTLVNGSLHKVCGVEKQE